MYSAKINGEPTTFGTSGLLYRSNKLMYDRATNSLWSQLLGEPVIGPLADSGIKLDLFPVLITTWEEWVAEHPDTTVLSLDTKQLLINPEAGLYQARVYRPEDDPQSIYYSYFNTPETMFPVWDRSAVLETKAVVLALSVGDAHKAYWVHALQQERVVNDSLGGVEVVVISSAASQGARAYERQGRDFELSERDTNNHAFPRSVVDSDGGVWTITEEALVNASDSTETLPRLPSHMSFWFGWYAFHPDTEVYLGAGG